MGPLDEADEEAVAEGGASPSRPVMDGAEVGVLPPP